MGVDRRIARLAGIVYFIQGALGIAGVAFPLYLRAHGFTIPQITTIVSLSSAPWFFKILYGAVSDAFPIRGLRRKPYLVLCSILSCFGWVLLALVPAQAGWLVAAMSVASLGLAATDVITDGFVVDHSDPGTAEVYQSISWGARSLGALASGVTGGFLAAKLNPKSIFLITSALPLLAFAAVLMLNEEKVERSDGRSNLLQPLVSSFRHLFSGDLKWFSALLLIAAFSASFSTPLFFFMREELKFDEIFLGLLQSTMWLGAVVGCVLFSRFFRGRSLKNMLVWAVGIGVIEILLVLIVRGRVSSLIVFLIAGILGYISLLPFMTAAAKLAHGTGAEGSLFAILMSVFNLGKAVAAMGGGLLDQELGLSGLIVLTAFLSLSGFLVIPRLKTVG